MKRYKLLATTVAIALLLGVVLASQVLASPTLVGPPTKGGSTSTAVPTVPPTAAPKTDATATPRFRFVGPPVKKPYDSKELPPKTELSVPAFTVVSGDISVWDSSQSIWIPLNDNIGSTGLVTRFTSQAKIYSENGASYVFSDDVQTAKAVSAWYTDLMMKNGCEGGLGCQKVWQIPYPLESPYASPNAVHTFDKEMSVPQYAVSVGPAIVDGYDKYVASHGTVIIYGVPANVRAGYFENKSETVSVYGGGSGTTLESAQVAAYVLTRQLYAGACAHTNTCSYTIDQLTYNQRPTITVQPPPRLDATVCPQTPQAFASVLGIPSMATDPAWSFFYSSTGTSATYQGSGHIHLDVVPTNFTVSYDKYYTVTVSSPIWAEGDTNVDQDVLGGTNADAFTASCSPQLRSREAIPVHLTNPSTLFGDPGAWDCISPGNDSWFNRCSYLGQRSAFPAVGIVVPRGCFVSTKYTFPDGTVQDELILPGHRLLGTDWDWKNGSFLGSCAPI